METLRNASIPSGVPGWPGGELERVDIAMEDGRIAAITPASTGPGRNLDGGLVLPCFADIHTHLDKGHIWPRRPNTDGTWDTALAQSLADTFEQWTIADVTRRMDFALRCAYAHGTAAIRTHLESAPSVSDMTWDAFDVIRERWAGRIELQAVSLVGPDLLRDRPALTALARRVKASGGLLGGAIRSYPQTREAIEALLETAGEHGLDVDLHADETLDPDSTVLLTLAETVIATGYTGRVTAGHCCSVVAQDEALRERTIALVAEAGIAIVSLPLCNLYLMDRAPSGRSTPDRRGVTLLHEFRAAGVDVAIASDNTRDPFYAYGDLDMLEVLREGARILHFDHPAEEAWGWAETVSGGAASIAGFEFSGRIEVGAPANLLAFRARNWNELLSRPQADRVVIRNGEAIDAPLPDYRELDDLMEA